MSLLGAVVLTAAILAGILLIAPAIIFATTHRRQERKPAERDGEGE